MSVDQLNPGEGKEVSLLTYQHIRESAHTLYGFATKEEKDIFLLLVDRVSGIGPGIAMAILSGMPVGQFKDAVVNDDAKTLATIKGLGKKTAERLIIELREKVDRVSDDFGSLAKDKFSIKDDAVAALTSLGYNSKVADKNIRSILETKPDLSLEDIIKQALSSMNK